MDILTRLDACAECEQAPLAPLLADAAAEIRMLRKDAERYRWLRDGENQDEAFLYVMNDADVTKYLTSDDMDAAIDAAMNGANAEAKPTREAGSA